MKASRIKVTRHSATVFIMRLAVVCNVLLAFAAVLSSRGEATLALFRKCQGEVVTLNLEANTLEIASADRKKTMLFSVEATHTRIVRDGRRSGFAELHPGDTVVAYYKPHYSGWLVTEITATSAH